MAKQFIKDNVIPILTMIIVSVGLVTTAVNTGRASGKLEKTVEYLAKADEEVNTDITSLKTDVSGMKEEQAFLKGVVSTQLTTIQADVSKMGKQIDDLIKAD